MKGGTLCLRTSDWSATLGKVQSITINFEASTKLLTKGQYRDYDSNYSRNTQGRGFSKFEDYSAGRRAMSIEVSQPQT